MKISDELIKFLNDRNIFITDKKSKPNNNSYTEEIKHIDNLIEVERIILSYGKPYSLGLSSFIWKDIEMFKMWNRRGRKLIKNYNLNELEEIVGRAEAAIDGIYKIPYLNLIHRSMKNKEICIGKVSQSNIWKDQNIKILDLSRMGFNLIEHDCYKYLLKYKKREVSLNYNKIIDYFIESHNLDNNSKIYIENLLSYPYDSMKAIQKEYLTERLNKEEIIKKSQLLMNFYNDSLI